MGGLTTDPDDPRLGRGVDAEQMDQHEVYLVLSEEERAKGFTRPYRDSYEHVGPRGPKYGLVELTPEQFERHAEEDYVAYEPHPESDYPTIGRYWTEQQLDAVWEGGCGTVTHMGADLSATYARDPSFYGATYCCGCRKHLSVDEFVWTADGERVGS